MAVTSEETFFAGLKTYIDDTIKEIMEPEIEAACERLRIELRKRVAHMTLSVLDHYTAETYGRELRIAVKLPEKV